MPVTDGPDLRLLGSRRFARTVAVHSFVVEFERVERSSDDVHIDFTEDSSATVLDAHGEPVLRTTHSVNRVVWRRENGAWSQVGGAELDVSRTIDGVVVTPDQDPIGVPAYRASQPRAS